MESSLAPIIDRVMSRRPGVYVKSHPRGVENNRPRIELHFSTFAPARGAGIRTLRAAVKEMKKELENRTVKVTVTD
jgi:molybdopterin-biosynthesis enzyme MoeA-like protein